MDSIGEHDFEPNSKRLKLSHSSPDSPLNNCGQQSMSTRLVVSSPPAPLDSSFTFAPLHVPSNVPDKDYILDITKYIPVGCLRAQKTDFTISSHIWKSCDSWRAFSHPRDVYNPRAGIFLLSALQETLLNSSILLPYRGLHYAGWIRMEFKIQDQDLGQIRVYILPDDVGRAAIHRHNLANRRAMQLLLSQLDISSCTWKGQWTKDVGHSHVDASLDAPDKDSASLFHMFNTLPSPKPEPSVVADEYAKDAMLKVMSNDVEGLKTTMHAYQRRSAALMLQREAQPDRIIDPRLRKIKDQKGSIWFCDVDAGSCFFAPRTYEAAKGGICAETMGLGKTLICLSLILATRDLSSQIPVEHSVGTIPVRKSTGSLKDMCAATIGRTATPWKDYFAKAKAGGYDMSQCVEALKDGAGYYFLPGPEPRRPSRHHVEVPPIKIWLTAATLVVVPSNLVRQWQSEIEKHTTGLKVLVMNNFKTMLPPARELAEYDIILFSKQRFDRESQDGTDDQGRRRTTSTRVCQCAYIGASRTRDCTCFQEDRVYRSPLKELHFKRMITDEGHTWGNSSKSSKTEAATVVDFLQLDARWVISGTPTQGLYGAEATTVDPQGLSNVSSPLTQSIDDEPNTPNPPQSSNNYEEKLFYTHERQDLEKLGNIATIYLKARPWANSWDDNDNASWSQYVMQPRHGSKSRGNMDCLRATLEGMIIRHRPEDVMLDVQLPPLYQNIVYLDGSMQDKLSLNMFSVMINSNAISSQREGADYLFHPRQRAALQALVSNLRQASFFWSGFQLEHAITAIDVAKKHLEDKDSHISSEDQRLLKEAIKVGETVLSNGIFKVVSQLHEMPMYIQNEFEEEVRAAWSLDQESRCPTLMGVTMVHSAQKFINSQLWKENYFDGMVTAGENAMREAYLAGETQSVGARKDSEENHAKRTTDGAPTLAGGVTVGDGANTKKKSRSASSAKSLNPSNLSSVIDLDEELTSSASDNSSARTHQNAGNGLKPKSILRNATEQSASLDPSSPLASARIVSTGSAKLSYLMDKISIHYAKEKILVFYEADNVAYYIAQALECIGISHLIYAKSLSSTDRAKYVVAFNQVQKFRVLLMDVSQAAFGLDMSSASRVYFVNPVFSPQVEAQAVKRAHRIGQVRPVYVETLVLNGSIEEVMLERRKAMSNEEHKKCKSILDDQTMYNWIRNVRFLPVPFGNDMPGPEQMAKLQTPQLLFGRGAGSTSVTHDPDTDFILDQLTQPVDDRPREKSTGKSKQKAAVAFTGALEEDDPSSHEPTREVRFAA